MSLDELIAIEQIKQLKARYFRAMDTCDWESFGQCFCTQGMLEVESLRRTEDGQPALSRRETGREEIVSWVSGVLAGATTIHHGHMPEIQIFLPGKASGIWAMEDRVIWPDRALHGWGHYHETYTIEGGAWRIATSRLTRLHVQFQNDAEAPSEPGKVMLDMRS